jgi:hypothetical protein
MTEEAEGQEQQQRQEEYVPGRQEVDRNGDC